jgi:hypothetical protein
MQRRVDRTYYYEVRVRSIVRPNLIRIGIVNQRDEHLIAAVAGAIAEELNERYGDMIEPSAVARTAQSLFHDLMQFPTVEEGDEPAGSASHLA